MISTLKDKGQSFALISHFSTDQTLRHCLEVSRRGEGFGGVRLEEKREKYFKDFEKMFL